MAETNDPKAPMPEQSRDLLLALDTSGDVCSAALFANGRLMAELAFRHEMHLSERLVGHIDWLLSGEGATLDDVESFAVGIGPGSFTGARIGVMTMKTFAFLRSKPLVAIDSLDVMAAEYCGVPGVTVTPILACRSGVVYACPFTVEGAAPLPVAAPAALTFEQLATLLGKAECETLLFCGPAAARYESELRSALGEEAARAAFGTVGYPRAASLGRLAALRFASGMPAQDPLAVSPLYISPPPITLPKQPIPT
jgi:tRNA threonylcarbamoyladenosine biosynthesis protein TsaB